MQKDHPPPKTETDAKNETAFERFRRLAKRIVASSKESRKS